MQQSIRVLEHNRLQLESMEQQLEFLSMTLRDHTRAKETMEGYQNLKENADTLIPIGGSSFLYAKVASPDKAMVGIGGDFTIETKISEAITKLEERIKDIDEAAKSLTDRYITVEKKVAEITAQVQQAYNSMGV